MMYFNKPLFLVLILFFGTKSIQAQESTTLTLQEAIQLALENGNKSKISQDKVTTAKNELKVTKNLRYPDAKISGQYQYLTNAKIDLQTSNGDNNGSNAEDNGGNSD